MGNSELYRLLGGNQQLARTVDFPLSVGHFQVPPQYLFYVLVVEVRCFGSSGQYAAGYSSRHLQLGFVEDERSVFGHQPPLPGQVGLDRYRLNRTGIVSGYVNLLLNLPIDVTTYNAGSVESIAILPYLAGKRRLVSKNATFILHKTQLQMPGRVPGSVLAAAAEAANLYDQNVEEILRGHLKMPDTKWKIHGTRELLISAKEAEKVGIAHEIAGFRPNGHLFHVSATRPVSL